MSAHLNEFIRQMETAAQNQALYHAHMPLPNLVLAAGRGAGVSTQLQEITKKICELELFVPSGEETFFEWRLGEGEEGFDQLLVRIRTAAGFYGRFKGFIALDLREMLSNCSYVPAMDRLQAFIRDSYGQIIFFFVVPEKLPENRLAHLTCLLNQPTPAHCFSLPMPSPDAACRYIGRRLQLAGFTLQEKAAQRLTESIEKLQSGNGYEGYNTLNNIADAVLWMKNAKFRRSSVIEEEILPILSRYTQTPPTGGEKHGRKIGFACEERRSA